VSTSIFTVTVEWGDCDGARIAFYPNFFRWMDAAAWHFFAAKGLSARERLAGSDWRGFPLVDAGATFRSPARFGDRLEIETRLARWGGKSLELRHVIRNAGVVAVEGRETRIWGVSDPANPERLRAGTIPAEIKALIREAKE
jgi:4-hydroxybenzoyl-CoA thioesterase